MNYSTQISPAGDGDGADKTLPHNSAEPSHNHAPCQEKENTHEKTDCCHHRVRPCPVPGRLLRHRPPPAVPAPPPRPHPPARHAAAETSSADAEGTAYRIAIVQQMDHSSLDQIRTAIEAELDARAAADGVTIEYKEFNGQNDATMLNQIGTQVVSDGYDAIIPIASLAAQCMVTAADGDIPVIYAAISDPATAGLTDLENVTGTSDALDTNMIMDMMFAVNPEIQTVGLLYSNSEPNSETPIAEAKAYLDDKGIDLCGSHRQHHRRGPDRRQRPDRPGGRRLYPH